MAIRHEVCDKSGVRAMQRLCQRLWPELPDWHIGDMAWGRNQHIGREPEWPTSWWEADGEIVAWAWTRLPSHLDLCVDPKHTALIPEILDWFGSVATEPNLAVGVLDNEVHIIDALLAAGYVRDDGAEHVLYWHRRDQLADLPAPVVPDGFTLRHVRIDDPEDLRRRVDVHRNAFAPSRVTVESYANVAAA